MRLNGGEGMEPCTVQGHLTSLNLLCLVDTEMEKTDMASALMKLTVQHKKEPTDHVKFLKQL